MKKIMIAASAALVMSAATVQAAEFTDDLSYGAGIGFVDLGLSESGTIFYGIAEKPLEVKLGKANSVAQLRLGTSTAASEGIAGTTLNLDATLDYLISGMFKASFDVQDKITAYGMLGFSYAKVTASTAVPGFGTISASNTDTSIGYGFGADFDVQKDLKIGVEYAAYFSDVTAVSVAAYFDF